MSLLVYLLSPNDMQFGKAVACGWCTTERRHALHDTDIQDWNTAAVGLFFSPLTHSRMNSHFIAVPHAAAVQALELQQMEPQRLRTGLPPGTKEQQQQEKLKLTKTLSIERWTGFTHSSPSWIWGGSLTDGSSFRYDISSDSSGLREIRPNKDLVYCRNE